MTPPSEKAKRAIQALLDDAERQGGTLFRTQIERTIDRRGLDANECIDVYRALQAQVVIERDDSPAEAGNSPEIEGQSDTEETEGVSPNEEPTAEILSSIPATLADHSLLSPAEEIELGRAVSLGSHMASAIDKGEVPQGPHASEIIRRGRVARERMIRSNMRLVFKIANSYAFLTSLDIDDLMQEGAIGLIRAVEKFDHAKGFRFSTYAFWWIRQSITRALADQGATIRLPVHLTEKLNRLRRAMRVLHRMNGGKHPSLSQLADELHWPREQVQFLLDLTRTVMLSLYTRVHEDGDATLCDTIPDEAPGPLDLVCAIDDHEFIMQLLLELPERDRNVIALRFGLDRVDERTLEEIGVQYGVTRERIRQIEDKALRKLRHPVRAENLRLLLDA